MRTLWLRLRAPFAAFRWLQAGVYRATSPVIPPSAAWGLALNLAHIDVRDSSPGEATTAIRPDAPALCLAVGQVTGPGTGTLYQQLHSYPVGSSGKELAARTHGAKHWIAPVRREVLVGFDCVLGVRSADSELLERIPAGLAGDLAEPRYGLPFAGDNHMLFDRIDVLDGPCLARWYARVGPDDPDDPDGPDGPDGPDDDVRDAVLDDPPRGSCRLTVAIDRRDSSRTRSPLFAPGEPSAEPPGRAWTWCPRPPAG